MMFEDRQTKPKYSFIEAVAGFQMGRRDRTKDVVDTAGQQLVFIAEMRVKGGSADVGAIKNLLYRDGVVVSFANQ